MDKVTFIEIEMLGVPETHAIIENADGGFTSMPKAEYDRRLAEAEQSTPNLS
jgi:hypothetical protein